MPGSSKKLRATLYPEAPEQPTLTITLPEDDKERLSQLQRLVGGYIDIVRVKLDDGKTRDAVINDEGKLNGLPINARASRLYWKQYPACEPSGSPNTNPYFDYLSGPVVVIDGKLP